MSSVIKTLQVPQIGPPLFADTNKSEFICEEMESKYNILVHIYRVKFFIDVMWAVKIDIVYKIISKTKKECLAQIMEKTMSIALDQ